MTLKYISKFLLSASLAGLLLACNKRLDISPRQSIDASTALSKPEDVDAAMVGCYSIMGGGSLFGTDLLLFPDLLGSYFPETEQYVSWTGTFTAHRQIARKLMDRNNGEAANIWNNAYAAINMANTVLEAMDVVTDPAQKDQLQGEALFVRGIMHFELVRLFAKPWGATANNDQPGVVIKTSATKTENQAFERIPRSTVAEVYTAVINDLQAAAAKLPEDNGTRANRYTALAYLARVYLQQGDYAHALDAANQVIESGRYAMNASVRAVFDNRNSAESIWEIQQNDQNNAGTSNNGMATFYASLPGIGRADVRMSLNFLNSYDPNDLRLNEWYYVGTGARPGNYYCSKWKSYSQNLPVIRIAEMYLIRAECNVRLNSAVGDTPENDLAQVRNPIRTNLPVIPNPTLSDILNERFHELAFEGFRIHDIRRLHLSFSDYNWDDDILVFPIPQAEVDATGGVIVQNPGY